VTSASKVLKQLGKVISDNSPTILTVVGVTGVASTALLAVKGAYSAAERLAHEPGDLPLKDKFAMTWHLYIPAAGVGAVTIICIVAGNSINTRRNAALASVYTLSETAFKEYRSKVAEQLGSHKEQKVRDDIARDRIANDPVEGKEVIVTGTGNVLCYDTLTGRYFESDMESLRKAQNDINAECINNMYASQNDFYRLVGLPQVEIGEEVGWTVENKLELEFTSILSGGKPCMAINYHRSPIRNYHKVW